MRNFDSQTLLGRLYKQLCEVFHFTRMWVTFSLPHHFTKKEYNSATFYRSTVTKPEK